MPYCTQQNLVDRFGENELLDLADRDVDGIVDAEVIAGAIADADAEIDGYIAQRYPLPLADVPPMLVRRACDITRFFLYSKHPTETVKTAYDEALRWLRDVNAGRVLLIRDTGAVAESAGMAEFETGRTVFTGGGF